MKKKLNTKVKFLSGGQRQSLSLVMAAMKHPDLLLLDEHTAALDPKHLVWWWKKTKELIKKIFNNNYDDSHNMKDAIEYSDRIIMLNNGKVVLDKPSLNVTENELIEIYKANLEDNIA